MEIGNTYERCLQKCAKTAGCVGIVFHKTRMKKPCELKKLYMSYHARFHNPQTDMVSMTLRL
ncbi:unnamed protein product [Amoebophrya sp. A25]|nr:unnamed protein product [Amoebophrya sp. A25]|eukprot:GSA25T00008286001.1